MQRIASTAPAGKSGVQRQKVRTKTALLHATPGRPLGQSSPGGNIPPRPKAPAPAPFT